MMEMAKQIPKNVAAPPVANPQWDTPLTGGISPSGAAPSEHQQAIDFLSLSQFAPASTRKGTLGLSGGVKKGSQAAADREAVGIPKSGGMPRSSPIPKEKRDAARAAAKASGVQIGMGLLDARPMLKAAVPEAQSRRAAQHVVETPKRYAGGVGGDGVSPKEVYEAKGWGERPEERVADNVGRQGITKDPRLLDIPKRWEEMEPEHQAQVLEAVGRFGVTPDSARHAFGTQLDRAMAREGGRHASFYEVGGQAQTGDLMPRAVLERTAANQGVGLDVAAAATAITSPQNRFILKKKAKKGEEAPPATYPNAESAEIGIQAAQAGESGASFLRNRKQFPKALSPHKTIAQAVDMAKAVLGGQQVPDVWQPGGYAGSGSGDKVRPFYNAQLEPQHPQGQFLVSDIHTGGHGMAPHLTQDEKVAYLQTPGVHAFHDKIARDLMSERGLTNVSRTQSAQWGQNKLETGTASDVAGMTPAAVNQGMAESTAEQPVQGRSRGSRRGRKAA